MKKGKGRNIIYTRLFIIVFAIMLVSLPLFTLVFPFEKNDYLTPNQSVNTSTATDTEDDTYQTKSWNDVIKERVYHEDLPVASERREGLPEQFTQLEYLRANGEHLLDTYIKGATRIKIDMTISFFNFEKRPNQAMGCYPQGVNSFGLSGGKYAVMGSDESGYAPEEKDRLVVSFLESNVKMTIVRNDGTEVGEFEGGVVNTTTNYNYKLFSVISYNSTELACFCKMYDCKIYDSNNSLIRDYVPCFYRDEKGKLKSGFYDLVCRTFTTSSEHYEDLTDPSKAPKNASSWNQPFNSWNDYSTLGIEIKGNGRVGNPYMVSTPEEWAYLTYASQRYPYIIQNPVYITLTNDIYLNDSKIYEDGTYDYGADKTFYFNSQLNKAVNIEGNGFTIYGSYMIDSGQSLFQNSATIRNLNVKNAYHETTGSGASVALLVSYASGTTLIENCNFQGYVKGTYAGRTGGLIHEYYKSTETSSYHVTIKNCTSDVSVNKGSPLVSGEGKTYFENVINYGNGDSTIFTGGNINSVAKNCTNYGNATTMFSAYMKNAIIENCKNYGSMKSAMINNSNSVSIINCQNYGTIGTSTANEVGMISGVKNSTISGCKNNGAIFGNKYVGGIIGVGTNIAIKDCWNFGKVKGNSFVGGIFGKIENSSIKNSVNKGAIVASVEQGAGLGAININSKILTCQNTGAISGSSVSALVFRNEGKIYNCLNNGDITGFVSNNIFVLEDLGEMKNCINASKCSGLVANLYVGDDFSAFYWKWKTGKIGLNDIDGNGFFQGEVNSSYFEEEGFLNDVIISFDIDENIEGYTKIEYVSVLNDSANGYENGFNTGVAWNQVTSIETKTTVSKATSTNRIMIFRTLYQNGPWIGYAAAGAQVAFSGLQGSQTPQYKLEDYVDGTLKTALYTFSSTNAGTIGYGLWADEYYSASSKLHSLKMYNGGDLIRSFVPVIRDADGAIGLYDQVERKFYANIGTGSFEAGPVID